MKKQYLKKSNFGAILVLLLGLFSCSKKSDDLSNLNETLFVKHEKADMPAHIHGNGSEKVFIILLHGGPGGNALQYRTGSIREQIEKKYAVVYFDQRGSGSSQGNYPKEAITIDLMAEDVLVLAQTIKAKYGDDSKLFLMGHSWGGTLGPPVLLKDQSYFSGWINVDGSHDPKGEYNAYIYRLTSIANEQIAAGNGISYWEGVLELLETIDPNYNLSDYGKLNGESTQAELQLVTDKVINEERVSDDNLPVYNFFTYQWNQFKIGNLLVNRQEVYKNVSYTDQLSQITIPSLVLFGKYDVIVPTPFAYEAYDNLGSTDKEIFIFEKSGHSPMFSEPELFVEKVTDFINKHK